MSAVEGCSAEIEVCKMVENDSSKLRESGRTDHKRHYGFPTCAARLHDAAQHFEYIELDNL